MVDRSDRLAAGGPVNPNHGARPSPQDGGPLPVGIVWWAFVTSRRQPQMPGRLVAPVDFSILKTFASGDLRRFPTRGSSGPPFVRESRWDLVRCWLGAWRHVPALGPRVQNRRHRPPGVWGGSKGVWGGSTRACGGREHGVDSEGDLGRKGGSTGAEGSLGRTARARGESLRDSEHGAEA